jgi:hypothetical protein
MVVDDLIFGYRGCRGATGPKHPTPLYDGKYGTCEEAVDVLSSYRYPDERTLRKVTAILYIHGARNGIPKT